ncbi:nuclear factor interleukin-3-regulated protein-like [Oppia nitens]|uniref:nuclear factor interleukin-3-regulated protein-like n=1 Tax=Oppia nitens TaxID=1686743 RepID=UPI0023D978B8|nr:nuclear factor interleukin-3-regulated protein-like [Oppia nitens]
MLLFSKANTMDNIDDPELRIVKHPRWTPSPVDLTIANTVPPASALIASLGAAYFCSGSPTTANSGYPLNGIMVSGQSSTTAVLSSRKQREFIPEAKKDDCYWDRRKRNNEAAKRSREKRRISDMVLEARVLELTRENSVLRAELYAIKDKFCLSHTQTYMDSDSVSFSESGGRGRRNRLLSNIVSTPNHNNELNSNGNSSTNYLSTSSSPTSQSSLSSNEPLVSTPSMVPNLSSHTYSPPNTQTMCCTPNANPNCPISPVNTTSLPFKLRHKAVSHKTLSTDSDSGSDTYANVLTDITPNHCVINGNIVYNESVNGKTSLNDSMLKSENFALRSELQRLATEVASLKDVLVYNPSSNGSLKNMTSDDTIHSHVYRKDRRSESPDLKIESINTINKSSILSNGTQSH